MFTEVTYAEYIENYKVRVLFNDGQKKTVDFYSLIFINDYPVFRPLKDLNIFRNFKVTDTIEWDNGNIDIAPETIYELGITE